MVRLHISCSHINDWSGHGRTIFSWLPQLTFRLAPGAVMVECGCVARAQNTSRWHWTICLKLKFNESIFWQLHKYFRKMLPHALHTNCLTILSCLGTGLYVVMYKICNTKLPKWVRVKGTLCPFCSNWIPGSSCWLRYGCNAVSSTYHLFLPLYIKAFLATQSSSTTGRIPSLPSCLVELQFQPV